jgi:hypothetical protein
MITCPNCIRLQAEELLRNSKVNFSAIRRLVVAAGLTAQPESSLSATPRALNANALTNFFAVGNAAPGLREARPEPG